MPFAGSWFLLSNICFTKARSRVNLRQWGFTRCIHFIVFILVLASAPALQAAATDESGFVPPDGANASPDIQPYHQHLSRPLIFRGDHNYPPFEYLNAQGQPEGFNIDIVQAVARVMHMKIVVDLGPWEVVRKELEQGRIDALTGMYMTPERDRLVDFSTPQLIVSYAVFVREDSDIETLEQAANRVIIVQQDDLGHDFVRENNLGSKVIALKNWEEVLRELSAGHGDLAIVSRLQGVRLIKRLDIHNLRSVGPPILQREYCLAVAEGNSELLSMINEGLSIIKTTGEYDRIYKKWFSVFEERSHMTLELLKTAGAVAAPLALLAVAGFAWSWSLKRKVRAKTRDLQNELRERARTEEALRESEARFRRITENAKDVIYRMALPSGQYEYINAASTQILGYSPEEIIAQPAHIARAIHPDSRDYFEKAWKNLLNGVVPPTYEYKVIHRSGETRWLFQRNVLVRDKYGNPVAIEGIVTDLTSRKLAEEERKKLTAQLHRAEKMETLGALAGGVAHDLNNVLGAIVGYPDLLLDDIEKDSPLREAIIAIKESGERAAAIVQDLLTLARRGVALNEVVNLNHIISEYLDSQEFKRLRDHHPQVVVDPRLDSNLFNIAGSPVHLSKVVMNLVLNAAEAMPAGGRIVLATANIYLDRAIEGYDTVEEGDYVLLKISDDGIGISREDLKRIFEPFYTRKVMGRSGSGLGMAVVWGAVKDHKGYIDIQSTPGRGTAISIYFPVTREAFSAASVHFDIEMYRGSGECILVVDDVAAQRRIAESMLAKLNYQTTTAASGEEALEILKDTTFDLLLLDMIMEPGIDGLETYNKVLDLHPGQKAIIASGFSETDRVREAQRLGAGAYIKKPYTLDTLAKAVKEELGR